MLSTIIKKEIHNNIFSFRFLITFILLMVIIITTILILTNDYSRKVKDYSQRIKEQEEYLQKYAHFNRINPILKPSQPPISFYSLIRGLSPDIISEEFDYDPLPAMFPLMDLTFIVTILFSLIAMLFSYDSICGEKEDGTLKLMMTNSFSKPTLVLGKIVAGMITLLIPFILSIITGMIIIHLNSKVAWKGSDWLALGLIILGSILYYTSFYCIGMFISSRHHWSSSSIMTSLLVWVFLVLIIPALSPYIASFLYETPSRIKIERETYQIKEIDRIDLAQKMIKEKLPDLKKIYPLLAENLSDEEKQKRAIRDPAYQEAYQAYNKEIQKIWDEAAWIQKNKAEAVEKQLRRREENQIKLSVLISMISPFSDFSYLATDICSAGIRNIIYFHQVKRRGWESAFWEYAEKKINRLKKENPAIDWWNTPIDMSDWPRFQYTEEALISRIRWVLPFFMVLVVFNLIFLLATYFSFIKYDIR